MMVNSRYKEHKQTTCALEQVVMLSWWLQSFCHLEQHLAQAKTDYKHQRLFVSAQCTEIHCCIVVEQPRNGGSDVGSAKKQTNHELREIEQSAEVLLRRRHDRKGQSNVSCKCVVQITSTATLFHGTFNGSGKRCIMGV